MSARAYLFLQGVCSPLFRHLARALRSAHCPVLKVNFNAGDLAYWGISGSRRYTGRLPALEAFLTDLLRRHDITDILLFGDCRPVHKPAVALAAQLGLRCHVLEEGYFRPYWFTLERGGVNRHSALPRDPHWYRAVAASLPPAPPPQTFQQPVAVRALHDFAYHAASMLNPLAFPHYRPA